MLLQAISPKTQGSNCSHVLNVHLRRLYKLTCTRCDYKSQCEQLITFAEINYIGSMARALSALFLVRIRIRIFPIMVTRRIHLRCMMQKIKTNTQVENKITKIGCY